MPDSVNVGTLEALLKVIYDPSGLTSFDKQLDQVKVKSQGQERETNKLIASFSRLAASLDPVFARQIRYQQSVDTLNRSLKAGIITQAQYNITLAQAQSQLREATTWTQRLGNEIGTSIKSGLGSYLAVGAIVAGLGRVILGVAKQVINSNLEAEQSQIKVADAIARSGDRAGVSVSMIEDLAQAESNLSGKDDEVIANAIAKSLVYNRISSEVLPRLTKASLDMAQVQGIDIPAAMDKSAKLINQPLKALTLLGREGYAVSASQAKMVKDLLRSNDVLGAQNVILDILESQYKGASAAARDSLGGALEALGTTWENFLEKVGEDRLGPLRQGVEELIKLVQTLTDNVDEMVAWWYRADIAINKVLLTIGKLQLGAAEGPLARFFNPKGAAQSAEIQRKAIAELESSIKGAERSLGRTTLNILAPGIAKSLNALTEIHRKGTGAALEQTEAEKKLGEELDKVRQKAEEAVEASRQDLSNMQALLQARKLGTEAVKLQTAIQLALSKAQAAGKAATSEQRLEIIRNTIATFQAKNAIDEIGESQKRAADLFAESNKEMLRQITILSDLAQIAIDLSKATIEINIEQVDSGGRIATETTRERLDYAKEWRNAWKSARERAQEEIDRIGASLLTIPEQERAIAEVRRQLLDEQLSEITTIAQGWTNLFSTLSNLFGGFGSKAINIINQMISTFQAVQSAGNSIGGQFGGMISSAGPFLAIAGAIVGAQRESAARDRARQYTSSAGVGFETGGLFEASGRRGRELASALEATLSPIMDLIDRTLASLPEIVVQAREDGRGFAAHINDVFLGYFATLEDAIDAAAIAALESIASTLPESLRRAIENVNAQTSEELQAAIEFAVNYDNLGLSDMALRVKDLYAQLRKDLQEAGRLGLGDGKILDKFNDDLQRIVYELTGVDTSTVDILDNLIDVNRVLSEQSNAIRQQHELRLQSLREELATMANGPRTIVNEEGTRAIQESAEAWERARRAVEAEISRLTGEIEKLPQALSDAQIDFAIFDSLFKYLPEGNKYSEEARKIAQARVAMEFELIKAKLIELGRWEQFSAMFNDAFNAAMAAAGREGTRAGRGGGSAGGDRDSAREFLRDRSFEIALRALGDYQRSVRELTRDYDIQIAAAGRDKKLREELIALRDKELAQLANEQRVRTEASFKQFMGLVTPFDQVRDTAADLIKQIEGSPYGDARKARMIARVLGEVEKQIDRLSRQTAVSLFGEMLSDMQQFGATEEEMYGARVAMATLEHTLKLDHYRAEIEILKAQGKLAPEIIAKLEGAFNFLQGIDPSKFVNRSGGGVGGGGGDNDNDSTDPYAWVKRSTTFKGYTDAVTTGIDSISDSLREAQSLLTRYTDDAMTPYLRAQRDFNREWALIFSQLGRSPEVMSIFNSSLARLNEQFSTPLKDLYDEISGGAFGGMSIDEQFAQTFANWEELSRGIRGGDLSLSDEYAAQGRRALELLGRIGGTTAFEYGELRDRLREELGGVLGASGGSSGGSQGQEAMAARIADSINTQGTRQVNRLGDVVDRLDTLVTVMGTPIQSRQRTNFGS